jgi:hypothetical protein
MGKSKPDGPGGVKGSSSLGGSLLCLAIYSHCPPCLLEMVVRDAVSGGIDL